MSDETMRTLRHICLPLFVSALLGMGTSHAARFEKPCSGKNETLECLKENFSGVYEDQYFKFLLILDRAETAALECDSPGKTAAYLDIASRIGKNKEVEDAFKDFLETRLLKEKTACLLDALLLNDDNVKDIILGSYMKKPNYITKGEINSILSKYRAQDKYQELLKRYGGE